MKKQNTAQEARPNPFALLLYSRKFWVTMANTTVTLVLYFASNYFPELEKDLRFVIGATTVPFMLLVGMITAEDVAQKR